MVTKRWIALVMSVTVLTGCSGSVPKGTAQHRAGCEEAVGQGVAASSSSARLVARANLSAQAQDLRGYMIKDGYRAITQRVARVGCHGYALGFGLTRCVAKAQLCGR